MLPKRVVRYIKKGLEDKQFEIKVVFLMRDPVERAWSHPRMINRIKNERGKASKVSSEDEFKQLKNFYKPLLCVSRTQHERTYSRIESIFPKKISSTVFMKRYSTKSKSIDSQTFLRPRNCHQTSAKSSMPHISILQLMKGRMSSSKK